jgi:hypothetical protein
MATAEEPKATTQPKTTTASSSSSSSSSSSKPVSQGTGYSAEIKEQQAQQAAEARARQEAEDRARAIEAERQRAEQARQNYARSIGGIAQGIRGQYETMIGQLPGMQSGAEANIAEQYGALSRGLGQQLESGKQTIDTLRSDVEARKNQSINEMARQMRSALQASQMQLGAMGAGNTSASELMLPYAFTKETGRQGAGIASQANQQMSDLDKEYIGIESQYNAGLQELDLWKSNSLNEVRNYYGQELSRLQQAKAGASQYELERIAELEMNTLMNAEQTLRQLEAESRNRQVELNNWAMEREAFLQDEARRLAAENVVLQPTYQTYTPTYTTPNANIQQQYQQRQTEIPFMPMARTTEEERRLAPTNVMARNYTPQGIRYS